MDRIRKLAVVLLFGTIGNVASAATITYLFTGNATGLLGGVVFQDANFTITALADSSNPSSPFSTVFSIDGVGSGSIAGTYVFANSGSCTANQEYPSVNSCVGIGLGSDILDVASNAFSGYVLGTAIGPITDLTSFGNVGTAFATSVGDWIFRQYGAATFTAIVGSVPVPEPGSLVLLLIGFASMLVARRRLGAARV